MLNVKKTLTKVLARFDGLQTITTKTHTSNIMGHTTENTMVSTSLDPGTYLITAYIYRASAVGTSAINRVLFRLYAGSTIIGNHDYKPSTGTNVAYINDTFTTMVKLTTTTTINLNGFIGHTADVGVDNANLYIIKLGG